MYSGIIEFIAEHTLHTVMLSGALAQSKRLGATHRTRLLPSEQFPRKTGEMSRRSQKGRAERKRAGSRSAATDA